MLTSPWSIGLAADADDIGYAAEDETPAETPTALFGTPQLGANDPLWAMTNEYPIDKSTVPDDERPHATGTVRILWDYDYLYARVEVKDSNLYVGPGADHTYDSVEFFVGPGSSGSNQWRVSATGVFSAQSHTDRAAWTEITDTGYIVEMRIPKRDLTLQPGKFTFEVNINNSTADGGDRYEVVSAFGEPDSGFGGHQSFEDSIELIPAEVEDPRLSIILSAETGGTITPNAPGNVLRVDPDSDITFTVIPDYGKVVEAVTVNGEPVDVDENNQFTLTGISANQKIHVTFKDDPAAEPLSFIVWNDNFARGEYTTAVIIDLGEGREALGSELDPGLFEVSARNTTLSGDTVVFEGKRNISRVYANDEPKVRGYRGKVHNSPDYREGLDQGRYIVVELEFYTEVGGSTTLDVNSNSSLQNYNIVQKGDIVLAEGDPITYAVFKQTDVVNPILDKFTTGNYETLNYALYIHKDEEGNEVKGLPLYVYTHGFSRGGTQAHIDQKASMKSANGSVALMKKMEEDPEKYASHILNISYSGGSAPQIGDVRQVIDALIADGLVDPNRIYAAGFSLGGFYTNSLVNTYPGFFAAAAPMGIAAGWPQANVNEAHRDLAYWIFVNAYDTRVGASNLDNFANDIVHMTNARASRFESNEALTWPYNQYDQPSQRPDPNSTPPVLDYIAHEVEAAVLYNQITMENPFTEEIWSIAPIMQSPNLPAWDDDYTDVFDWMFSQRRLGVPDVPGNFTATAGNRKVTLTWSAPSHDGGKEILGYKVWFGDNEPVTLDAMTHQYTFTGLSNGQEYTFKIVAFNENGDSAAASVSATPTSGSSGGGGGGGGGAGGGGGGTSEDTDAAEDDESPDYGYTLITPEDQPAITDEDGITTLPGGGEIVLENGITIQVPAGTTIDESGTIVIGSGGATVILDAGWTLNIREGAELVLDEDFALGFYVASGNPFDDVNENAWFYDYVNTAYTFSLFDGTSSSTFSPNAVVTRAMIVQVLANLEDVDRSEYTASSFIDVADGAWYTAAIEWAAENGIVHGIGGDRFAPNAPLTREQMMVILYNYLAYAGYEIPEIEAEPFADEDEISPWALEAVQALRGIELIAGKGNNRFDPKGTATRAEIATVFVKLIEYLAQAEE
jgi:predicted peptidase